MAKIVDMERARVEELAVRLVPMFREQGTLVADVADLEDVRRWRRSARRAGQLLGWRVRTGLNADQSKVWALSPDWPVPPGTVEAGMRRMSEMLLGPQTAGQRTAELLTARLAGTASATSLKSYASTTRTSAGSTPCSKRRTRRPTPSAAR